MMILLMSVALAVQPAQPAVPAAGQEVQPRPTDFSVEPVALLIAGFDADRDARVTRAELDAGIAATFGATGDSMSLIDFGHWATRWLGHRGALPGRFDFDQDHDDQISRAEYATELTRNFDRLDQDRDGILTRSELVAIKPPPQPPLPRRGRRR